MVSTVEENKQGFTKREIEAADQARKLFITMARPSIKDFERLLTGNHMINCPVTLQDFRNAIKIYGLDVGVIKGRSTRESPAHTELINYNSESSNSSLNEVHKVILCSDIMYVDKQAFMITSNHSYGHS